MENKNNKNNKNNTTNTENKYNFQDMLNNISNVEFVGYANDSMGSIFSGVYKDKEIILTIKTMPIKNLSLINPKKIVKTFENERFSKYEIIANNELEIIQTYPAKKEDFVKNSTNKIKILETPELYFKNVYPKIKNQNLEWIDNIILGNKEADKVLFNDDDFIFLPDLKWDLKDIDSLYYLAIVKDKRLMSLRDLNTNHLNLLNKIYNVGTELLCAKYNISKEKIRVYFHYHPSFWQLHVHFNLVNKKVSGAMIDFSHLMQNVINNINLMSDYYQKATIEIYTVPDGCNLE